MSNTDGRPLVSTQDSSIKPAKEKNEGNGCLTNILGIVFWIFVISIAIRSCGKGDTDKPKDSDTPVSQQTESITQQPDDMNTTRDEASQDGGDALTLSDKAASVEKRYFHKFYTDMGTVEIHHFKERNQLLENSVGLLEQAAQGDFEFLDHQAKIFTKGYYYITADTASKYYYVGQSKDNRPDGFGMIFGLATGSGTYEFADQFSPSVSSVIAQS